MKRTGYLGWVLLFMIGLAGCINPGKTDGSNSSMVIPGKPKPAINKKVASDNFLHELLSKHPQYFDVVLKNADALGVQVIYTQIDRGKKGKVQFTDHFFNVNPDRYFYPASTVKFPVAILALQKLNELAIPGLDMHSTMITGVEGEVQTPVQNDPSAPDGRPTIAHYIKKILLVSDNDAFNRLYEFLGQEYINNNLRKMGYTGSEIIHRLSISLSDDQNRHTNPVKFLDKGGKILYEQPAIKSTLQYSPRDTANGRYRLGKGFMRANTLVNEAFDFSRKNLLTLADLHQMTRSIIFPASVPKGRNFRLTGADLDFLRRYMSMVPGESRSPVYDNSYWDNYVKTIYYGSEKTKPEAGIRIFNKTGTAYGFLSETNYFVDFNNNIEFMVSAVIYCNSDGIFNDDKYDYDAIGYPFLKQLGRVLYTHEKQRTRKRIPDLSSFRFEYAD